MQIKFTVPRFVRRYGEIIDTDDLPKGAGDRFLTAGVAIAVAVLKKKKKKTKKKVETEAVEQTDIETAVED